MPIVRIIVFAIIGFILGFGLFQTSEFGYFKRWEKLSSPSNEISNYLSPTQKQYINNGPLEIRKPCDYTLPEFSLFSNAPKNILECVQLVTLYPEGETRETYVRDNDGHVWRWSISIYISLNELMCWPGFGMLLGFFVAILTIKPKQATIIDT